MTAEENPLFTDEAFPLWDQVKAEHVQPGMTAIFKELNSELDDLEKSVQPTWSALIEPVERITDRLARAWGTISHLKAVKDTKELREAVEAVQPERVKISLRMSQSKPLYEAFQALKDGPEWAGLTEAQRRIVDGELKDFVLGGVALEGEAKEQFNEMQQEMAKLGTKFSNNVLDSTKAWKKMLTTKEEVAGLPASALALTAQQAKTAGEEGATAEEGPWLLTLDFPSYLPVMTHSTNRDLREEVYRAFITRASTGDADNTPIIEQILTLRKKKAELLGYKNFAEVSMASKMAELDTAEKLLTELSDAAYTKGIAELAETEAYARAHGHEGDFLNWDTTFWSERMKEEMFSINDELLRPYFSLPVVLDGLFALAGRLFGVTVEAADGQVPVWDQDVRFFCLKKDGAPKSYFYLDPYSRPAEKRAGAWFDEVVGQSKLFATDGAAVRLPVGHMVCNQTPPIGDSPSLMTFREVETLFHEFGHCLQHMMTTQEEGLVAGIRGVEWDAVELPSQFMENWCYDYQTLMSFAKHHETGEPLPKDLFDKLKAAKTYKAASMMLRQIHFSSLDLELHSRFEPGSSETIYDCDRRLAAKTCPMKPLPEDRFLCSFAHIFAGGYSAGYYSYKWAEVLSADAFGAFEEAGLDNDEEVRAIGNRFRDTVLSLGGGRDPLSVFKDFRGREPSTEALLRHSDLSPAIAA